jgi:hypothetical protein
VLRHFNSKAAPLGPVIDRCRRALADLRFITQIEAPPIESQRRQLLIRFANLPLMHAEHLRLLGNEVFRPIASPWSDRETAPTAKKDRY